MGIHTDSRYCLGFWWLRVVASVTLTKWHKSIVTSTTLDLFPYCLAHLESINSVRFYSHDNGQKNLVNRVSHMGENLILQGVRGNDSRSIQACTDRSDWKLTRVIRLERISIAVALSTQKVDGDFRNNQWSLEYLYPLVFDKWNSQFPLTLLIMVTWEF